MLYLLGIASGILLTLMIKVNAVLAGETSPFMASLLAHLVGTVSSFFTFLFIPKNKESVKRMATAPRAPSWSYLGGILGAGTVILASYSANTWIGISGTIALSLSANLFFSLCLDKIRFGISFSKRSSLGILCIFIGALMMILGKGQ